MKQQAIDNLKNAIHLGESFNKQFSNIQNATKEGKYAEASGEVQKWRKQVDILQEQIDGQLSHCKRLRENTILKSLCEEDSSIVVARKARNVMNFLKHDVVNLNNNFPKVAYDLKPSLNDQGRGRKEDDLNESDEGNYILEDDDFDEEEEAMFTDLTKGSAMFGTSKTSATTGENNDSFQTTDKKSNSVNESSANLGQVSEVIELESYEDSFDDDF